MCTITIIQDSCICCSRRKVQRENSEGKPTFSWADQHFKEGILFELDFERCLEFSSLYIYWEGGWAFLVEQKSWRWKSTGWKPGLVRDNGR